MTRLAPASCSMAAQTYGTAGAPTTQTVAVLTVSALQMTSCSPKADASFRGMAG